MNFTQTLIHWYLANKRDLPWRNISDPYKIWVSEIILQQTRVAQGTDYYHRFLAAFPDILSLANASEDQVLKLWQGLGYYSRARNMHFTAQFIRDHFNGIFPSSYLEILKLKGIGEYTAAAIASLAFGEPVGVVDGNVLRFFSRHFGVETAIDSGAAQKLIRQIVNEMLDAKNPAAYNQAIMEMGALMCTPKNPKCAECPFHQSCFAFENQKIDQIPLKGKKTKVTNRYFNYLFIRWDESFFIQKRTDDDIWKNLYEFPMIETDNYVGALDFMLEPYWRDLFGVNRTFMKEISPVIVHKLSHQKVHIRFYEIIISENKQADFGKYLVKVNQDDYEKYAVPKPISNYLNVFFQEK